MWSKYKESSKWILSGRFFSAKYKKEKNIGHWMSPDFKFLLLIFHRLPTPQRGLPPDSPDPKPSCTDEASQAPERAVRVPFTQTLPSNFKQAGKMPSGFHQCRPKGCRAEDGARAWGQRTLGPSSTVCSWWHGGITGVTPCYGVSGSIKWE